MVAQSLINKINPIDNTTVVTSVSFMSICIGLIVFVKKFPFDTNVTTMILIVLSITTTLFGMSALISYIDIARTTCQKVDEVLNIKFIAYLMGIVLFGISAMMAIYPY